MSNARSPREVCSTTIGIRGISSLLAAGGPHLLRLLRRFLFLVRCPKLLTRLSLLGRDLLHLGGDAVERLSQSQIRAHALGSASLEELVDVFVFLALLSELGTDLVVGHVETELVRRGL